jgi:hypothetical protein
MSSDWDGTNLPPDTDDIRAVFRFALALDGYTRYGGPHSVGETGLRLLERYRQTGQWEGSLDELCCCLFFLYRAAAHGGDLPQGEHLEEVLSLYRTLRSCWAEGEQRPD